MNSRVAIQPERCHISGNSEPIGKSNLLLDRPANGKSHSELEDIKGKFKELTEKYEKVDKYISKESLIN